jgi:hypothetical protein
MSSLTNSTFVVPVTPKCDRPRSLVTLALVMGAIVLTSCGDPQFLPLAYTDAGVPIELGCMDPKTCGAPSPVDPGCTDPRTCGGDPKLQNQPHAHASTDAGVPGSGCTDPRTCGGDPKPQNQPRAAASTDAGIPGSGCTDPRTCGGDPKLPSLLDPGCGDLKTCSENGLLDPGCTDPKTCGASRSPLQPSH